MFALCVCVVRFCCWRSGKGVALIEREVVVVVVVFVGCLCSKGRSCVCFLGASLSGGMTKELM